MRRSTDDDVRHVINIKASGSLELQIRLRQAVCRQKQETCPAWTLHDQPAPTGLREELLRCIWRLQVSLLVVSVFPGREIKAVQHGVFRISLNVATLI